MMEKCEPEILRHLKLISDRMKTDYDNFCEKQSHKLKSMKTKARENGDDYLLQKRIPEYKKTVEKLKKVKVANLNDMARVIEIMEVMEFDSSSLRKKITTFCSMFDKNIIYNGKVSGDLIEDQTKMLMEFYLAFKRIDDETTEIENRKRGEQALYITEKNG